MAGEDGQVMTERVIVAKGVEGFGDRLQSLLYALQLGIATNARVLIDWRDPIWTGCTDGESFDKTALRTVKLAQDRDVFEPWMPNADVGYFHAGERRRLAVGRRVTPEFWKRTGLERRSGQWLYKHKDELIAGGAKLVMDDDADVLVVTNIGYREVHPAGFAALVWTEEVGAAVRAAFSANSVLPFGYIAVHCRGTDRRLKGDPRLDTMAALLSARWDAMLGTDPSLATLPVLLVGDDAELMEQVRVELLSKAVVAQIANKTYVEEVLSVAPVGMPTHMFMLSVNGKVAPARTKAEMNKAAIVDWWLCAASRALLPTQPQSVFYTTADAWKRWSRANPPWDVAPHTKDKDV